MSFDDTRQSWQRFGESDPLWAVLTDDKKRGNRWDADEFFATGRVLVQSILSYAESAGATIQFGRALDFGCGVGRLTQALAERFEYVIGVDVASSMIDRARGYNRFPASCEYRTNTTDHLQQLPSESFDFVLTIIVLQHIEPPFVLKYLAEFLRVLRPGGVLVFQQTSHQRWWPKFPARDVSLKQRVLRLVPRPILSLYANTKRWVKGEPKMSAYGIPSETIVHQIGANGGHVLDVSPDDWGGPGWFSHHYCVIKKGAP